MVDVTELIWKLIIAVAPIIVSAVFSIIQATISRMSLENQNKISYWVGKFVDAAQMLEPDPLKRKAWVVEQVSKMFPKLDKEKISALIEAVIVDRKLSEDESKIWENLPSKESRLP